MSSSSYFAQLYFPSFYFPTSDSVASGFTSARLSGSSSVYAFLEITGEPTPVEVSSAGWVKVPWHTDRTQIVTAPIKATLNGNNVFIGSLSLSTSMASICSRNASVLVATLTENTAAKVRYKRRKEEEALSYFLLAA